MGKLICINIFKMALIMPNNKSHILPFISRWTAKMRFVLNYTLLTVLTTSNVPKV